jgi:hypothetical protein
MTVSVSFFVWERGMAFGNIVNLIGLALQSGADAIKLVATSVVVSTQSDPQPVLPTQVIDEKQQLKDDLKSSITSIGGEIVRLQSNNDYEEGLKADDPVITYAKSCKQFLEDVLRMLKHPPKELINIDEFIDDALTILYLEKNDPRAAIRFINEDLDSNYDRKKYRMGLYRYLFQIERDGNVPIQKINEVFTISEKFYVKEVVSYSSHTINRIKDNRIIREKHLIKKNRLSNCTKNTKIHLFTSKMFKSLPKSSCMPRLKARLVDNMEQLISERESLEVDANRVDANRFKTLDAYINKGGFNFNRHHIKTAKALRDYLSSNEHIISDKLSAIKALKQLYAGKKNFTHLLSTFSLSTASGKDNPVAKEIMKASYNKKNFIGNTTGFYAALEDLEKCYKNQILEADRNNELKDEISQLKQEENNQQKQCDKSTYLKP